MPDIEENKTVDIDTSGPDTEVELDNTTEENTEQATAESTETSSTETVETASEETKEEKTDEKKDRELENYSKDVQRRIAKLTGKWREAQRQADDAAEYARAQIKLREQAEAKISKLEPGYLKSTEDSIVSGMQAAQAKLAAAREANDLKAESEALTIISELGYKRARLQETKLAQEEYNQKQESLQARNSQINLQRQQMPEQQVTPDPKAEDWASKNSWFGQDSAMTYTAFDLHKKLTEEEGYDPESDEYYSEIDKRIRLEFPHKFAKKESKETIKPVQTVASAKRSTKTGRKTVTLTPSQVAIARKLGVPLEEYAKHLNTKEV